MARSCAVIIVYSGFYLTPVLAMIASCISINCSWEHACMHACGCMMPVTVWQRDA